MGNPFGTHLSPALIFLFLLLTVLPVLSSCSSIVGRSDRRAGSATTAGPVAGNPASPGTAPAGTPPGKPRSAREAEEIRKKLLEGAEIYSRAKALSVGSRSFNMDCSGLVSAIYWYAGIDLQKYYSSYGGTGTERIYSTLADRKLIKKTWMPEPGDIIFWDNTFDRNGNGREDDKLTHVGMVVSADRQGNIVYIHHSTEGGIVFEKMNLRYKNYYSRISGGKEIILNSPLRPRPSGRSRGKWLSGQLFNSFGKGYYLY